MGIAAALDDAESMPFVQRYFLVLEDLRKIRKVAQILKIEGTEDDELYRYAILTCQSPGLLSTVVSIASMLMKKKNFFEICNEKDKVLSLENLEDGKAALIRYLSDKYGTKIGPDFNFEDEVRAEVIAHDNEIAAKKAARERVKENKMKEPTQLTLGQAEQKFANKTFCGVSAC